LKHLKHTVNPYTEQYALLGAVMTPEELTRDLRGKWNGSSGMAHCPHHDDRNPSLSISAGDRVPIVVKCHAGCPTELVIADLRAQGRWPDLRPVISSKRKTAAPDDDTDTQLVGYRMLQSAVRGRDENGSPAKYLQSRGIELKQVPRTLMMLSAKQSRRHTGRGYPAMIAPISDGNGIIGAHVTWLSSDLSEKCNCEKPRKMFGPTKGGFIRLAVVDPNGPLIVGEGIESTLSAMQLAGLPGVAARTAGGIKALRPPPCSEVVIAADNDENGVGLKAAQELAVRLRYEGRKYRIVMPRTEGWDWNDVLMERGLEKAKVAWLRAYEVDVPIESDEPISAIPKEAFMELAFPKRTQMLGPWLPKPGLVMVHAPRGQGKTWFTLSVANAVANRQDFLGWKVPSYGRVLYIDGELPGSQLQDRLERFEASPQGAFQILCRDMFHLFRQQMPDLKEDVGRRTIDRIVERCTPDLIILDSISTLVRSGMIENDSDSWQVVQDWLLLHRLKGRTVLLVHHDNKSGAQRGTSKREDVLDTVIQLKKRELEDPSADAEASFFDLTFTKSRDFYGKDAEPLFLRLAMEDGKVAWSHETLVSDRERQVQELLGRGLKQTDIAKELGLTKGRISQIVAKLKEREL
jgi:putative DNA primase/helicase